jgi:hypothetical protein
MCICSHHRICKEDSYAHATVSPDSESTLTLAHYIWNSECDLQCTHGNDVSLQHLRMSSLTWVHASSYLKQDLPNQSHRCSYGASRFIILNIINWGSSWERTRRLPWSALRYFWGTSSKWRCCFRWRLLSRGHPSNQLCFDSVAAYSRIDFRMSPHCQLGWVAKGKFLWS